MNASLVSPTPPLTPLKELVRRSEHDATLLVSDSTNRIFVQKLIPAPVANLEVWQALSHTSIPALVKVWQVTSEPWGISILMDYISGPTLEQLVESQGALTPQLTATLISQIAQGAAALHEQGIVHRDLSCANIVVGPAGACIIDAGIARLQAPDPKRHDTVLLGTQGFAAPEQYGFAETSPRTDVYALGKLAGYLLTGVSPASPVYEEALDDPAVVPASLRMLIEQACSLSPTDRPASALSFAQELQRAVNSLPAEKPAPPQPTAAPQSTATSQPAASPQVDSASPAAPQVGSASPAASTSAAVHSSHSLQAVPVWRERLATIATVAGAAFCALMSTAIFLAPTDATVPAAIWKLQAICVGLFIGLAPGLITRWYLLRQRQFATVKHPLLTWISLLIALFFIAVALVGITQAMFEIRR